MNKPTDQRILLLASMLYANVQIQLELIDKLEQTPVFKQSLKNKYRQVQKENERMIEQFHDGISESAEMIFYKLTSIAENFVTAVEKHDLNLFGAVMSDFVNERIRIEDEDGKTIL